MRLGLIGCGSIGSAVVKAIASGCLPGLELAGIADLAGSEGATRLATSANCPFSPMCPLCSISSQTWSWKLLPRTQFVRSLPISSSVAPTS